MAQCVGIKKNGVRCSTMCTADAPNTRCGVHRKTLEKVGPNRVRREEAKYFHDKMNVDSYELFRTNNAQLVDTTVNLQRIYEASLRRENIRYQIALDDLEILIIQETNANGGINADQVYIDRRLAAQRAEDERRNQIRQQMREQRRMQVDEWENARRPPEGLAAFAVDRQNVHTALVVNKVMETVRKVLTIPVPPDYQTDTLKTLGEIILECNLSKSAAWHMSSRYCADENIYELGPGIYANVLNSVWQYIKTSSDSTDLKKILKVEMTDNIGMCAQGALSRLCNILSGYLDGISTEVKSRNEILGELFAELMDIENVGERIQRGVEILHEHNVQGPEREAWIEPLTV